MDSSLNSSSSVVVISSSSSNSNGGNNKHYNAYNSSSHNNNNNNSRHGIKGSSGTAKDEISVGVISSSNVASSAVATNSIKTAHTKVATSGGHANTQPPSKRSSSGADGDYQLVQHEVLYSLSAEYEVRIDS